MKPTRVEVTIDELILHGFASGDRTRIALAVEHEIARLLTAQGVPAQWTRSLYRPQLDAGAFTVNTGDHARDLGTGIANVTYQGLSR